MQQKISSNNIYSNVIDFGVDLTGISGEIYTSVVGPKAVTVFVQKIWDSLTKKLPNSVRLN